MNDKPLPMFRTEALDSARPKTFGRIILIRPTSFAVLTSAASLVAASIIGIFVFGRYTQKVELVGQLVPATGIVSVFPKEKGSIVERRVSAGDEVGPDQVLFIVSRGPDGEGNQGTFAVVAPGKGTVTTVIGEVGQAVDPVRPLLVILPDDAELEARLFAPTRAVGLIRPESPVVLRYDAYPYQRFGHFRGTIKSVSRAAITSAEPSSGPAGGGEPLYLIKVALPSQTVLAYGEPQRLLAGMTVHADVLQDTRRLYEWVLEPLSSAGKLIHEAGQ